MEEQKMFSLCLNFVIRIFARMRAVSVIDFSFATTMHILLPLNADSFFYFEGFSGQFCWITTWITTKYEIKRIFLLKIVQFPVFKRVLWWTSCWEIIVHHSIQYFQRRSISVPGMKKSNTLIVYHKAEEYIGFVSKLTKTILTITIISKMKSMWWFLSERIFFRS